MNNQVGTELLQHLHAIAKLGNQLSEGSKIEYIHVNVGCKNGIWNLEQTEADIITETLKAAGFQWEGKEARTCYVNYKLTVPGLDRFDIEIQAKATNRDYLDSLKQKAEEAQKNYQKELERVGEEKEVSA